MSVPKVIENGQLYKIKVSFRDKPDDFKVRPVIIVSIGNEDGEDTVLVLVSTTTQEPSNPMTYHDQFKLPVFNWRKLGLDRGSYFLCSVLIEHTLSEFQSLNPEYIGKSDEGTYTNLVTRLQEIHK